MTEALRHISALDPQTDCLGKTASTLGTVTFAGGKVSGTLNRVTGYSGFSGSSAQQEGYFIPFQYDGSEELKFNVKGKQVVADKAPEVNIAFLGKDKGTAQAAALNIYVSDETHAFSMTDITFNEGV